MFDKLIDLIIQFARAFQCWRIIKPWQGGVVLRNGRFIRTAHVGRNWTVPFYIDELVETNVVTETMLVGPQSLVTRDGQQVVISTVITFHVDDVKTFLLEIEGAGRVIEDSTFGVVSDWIKAHTWDRLVAEDVANELEKKLRARAKRFGVYIERVQIADLTKSRSIRLLQSVNQSYATQKEL